MKAANFFSAPRWIGNAAIAVIVVGWWLVARHLPSFVIASPIDVATRLAQLLQNPDFYANTFASIWRLVFSIVLALITGCALAITAREVPSTSDLIERRIKPLLNSFPSIGWAILAAIWFQPGDFAVVFVETLILVPFCYINCKEGLGAIDQDLVEMGHSFTRKKLATFWYVVLPMLAPFLIAAARMCYGIGWKIALVSELLGAPSGLGALMLRAQTSSDMATFMAACLMIVLIAIAGEKLVFDRLESWLRL